MDLRYKTQSLAGMRGASAYDVAVENGFEGTVEEWLDSLQGPAGEQGVQGETGPQGPAGQNATINGYQNMNIVAGARITLKVTPVEDPPDSAKMVITTVNVPFSTSVTTIEKLTKAEYEALTTKDATTLYLIVG